MGIRYNESLKTNFSSNVKKYKYFTKSFENMKLIYTFANVNAAQIERFFNLRDNHLKSAAFI